MELTGADIVCQCLIDEGIDTVFGYPGGAILNIYDSLYKHQDKIKHILTAHEQGASHAADGYARATGKVGVCLATSGPGATNLVTGLATAFLDSIPMIAITVNVAVSLLGKDTFQEVDIASVTMPVTKHNFIVKDINELESTMKRAFRIARNSRPGPVLIDITKDVTGAKCQYINKIISKSIKNYNKYTRQEIEKAVEMMKKSKKPFIFSGGGVIASDANKELAEFVRKMDSPIAESLMGKGSFDNYDPLFTGLLGMHGTKTSNYASSMCDLLLIVGARLSDRVISNSKEFATNAKILHIDIDPSEIDKNVVADLGLIGNVKDILKEINDILPEQNHKIWLGEISGLKEKYPLTYNKEGLTGPYIIEKISEITKGNAVITTEVGQNQMWAAQFYKSNRPRHFISSGGLGTMGYGLGASIGAKLGCPEKVVFNIAGDGSFRMNLNELGTVSRYNIPIIQVILNNNSLGMVRQWQTLFYDGRYSSTVLKDRVDFCEIAEGFGCKAMKITKKEEVLPAIEKVIKSKEPYVLECIINEDDMVLPMVIPGTPIIESLVEKDVKEIMDLI
ncbi:biosynthetic-type acetolactate synthase large subunit [Fusobacterium sp. PH5-44]|uniref:biosynthetic-type acetolactate synthase large subunit n=1 Tax=unclassified Fusobacterium TaxID=2648384 RepID=UPI003D1A6F3C